MLLEEIARAVENANVPRCRIAQACDIDESCLCRVVRRQGGLSLQTADRLCEHLDLVLVPRDRVKKRRGGAS